MGNLTTALMVVLTLNILMFVVQASMNNIADAGNQPKIYNCEGTMLGTYSANCSAGDTAILDNTDVPALFPGNSEATSPTTGNIFTDVFTSIKNWFLDTLGLKYIYNILTAPYNIIKIIGLPNEIEFALSTFWYGLTAFLVIAFLWWRD